MLRCRVPFLNRRIRASRTRFKPWIPNRPLACRYLEGLGLRRISGRLPALSHHALGGSIFQFRPSPYLRKTAGAFSSRTRWLNIPSVSYRLNHQPPSILGSVVSKSMNFATEIIKYQRSCIKYNSVRSSVVRARRMYRTDPYIGREQL